MKKLLALVLTAGLMLSMTSITYADDRQVFLPIIAGMDTPAAHEKLDGSIRFYFANQHHPRVLKKLSSDFFTRKTNAFAKSDAKACNWVFLSGMLALQKQAQDLGANAVINIVSYYDKTIPADPRNFECRVGAITAGVVLKGDFVILAGK